MRHWPWLVGLALFAMMLVGCAGSITPEQIAATSVVVDNTSERSVRVWIELYQGEWDKEQLGTEELPFVHGLTSGQRTSFDGPWVVGPLLQMRVAVADMPGVQLPITKGTAARVWVSPLGEPPFDFAFSVLTYPMLGFGSTTLVAVVGAASQFGGEANEVLGLNPDDLILTGGGMVPFPTLLVRRDLTKFPANPSALPSFDVIRRDDQR